MLTAKTNRVIGRQNLQLTILRVTILAEITWFSKVSPWNQPSAIFTEFHRWCHGAPGIVILFATTLRIFEENKESILTSDAVTAKIRTAIRRGAALVYKCGLLRKGVGLCHGTAGSVYALLSASAVLDTSESSNRQFFLQAVHLAHLATFHRRMTTSKQMTIPDHPWSLYEGLAGMCCAWAEVLHHLYFKGPLSSAMPGYDDLI